MVGVGNSLGKGHSVVLSGTLVASVVVVHSYTRDVVASYVVVRWGLWVVVNVPPHSVGRQCLQKRSRWHWDCIDPEHNWRVVDAEEHDDNNHNPFSKRFVMKDEWWICCGSSKIP